MGFHIDGQIPVHGELSLLSLFFCSVVLWSCIQIRQCRSHSTPRTLFSALRTSEVIKKKSWNTETIHVWSASTFYRSYAVLTRLPDHLLVSFRNTHMYKKNQMLLLMIYTVGFCANALPISSKSITFYSSYLSAKNKLHGVLIKSRTSP
jgi:hypothetical protein